uniref:Fibronectin type-III domain-containing protein n=1 Tax=Mesocestoides corti TaxID=53468 RepID=A0A5K3EN22_MESCO
KNTTVVVRRKNSVEQVGSCSVSEPGSERSCTVTGLNSNEDYVASAVACYDGLGRCSEETDSIEVSTLPGVLSQVNSSDLSGHSVVVKWQQPSGILTDL